MKVKAKLKGKELLFPSEVILLKDEVEVEVELPDEEVRIITEESVKEMSLYELADLIWRERQLSAKEVDKINRSYREILADSLQERYDE